MVKKKGGRKSKARALHRSFSFGLKPDYILVKLAEKKRLSMTVLLERLIEQAGKDEKIEYPAQVVPGTLVEG